MAKIEDFGRHVPSAAKHKRPAAPSDTGLPGLNDIFPDRPWGELAVFAANAALARALREEVGAPPAVTNGRMTTKRARWERQARHHGALAARLVDSDDQDAAYRAVASDMSAVACLPKARLYRALGHGESLARISVMMLPSGWTALQGRAGKGMRILFADHDFHAFTEKARSFLGSSQAKLPNVSWGTRSIQGGASIMICARVTGRWIDVEPCASAEAAKRLLQTDKDRLSEQLHRVLNPPRERHDADRSRIGPDRRDGPVDEEAFIRRFGVSAQFGASLPEREKAANLGETYDAFVDMADALGWESSSISFGGRLAIGFGSRGKGGRNAAKAHYEPHYNIINLTRRAGAGSLGHEWWHGWDLNDDSITGGFSSERRAGPFRDLMQELSRTGIATRSKALDAGRAKPYWQTDVEVSARCFEAWMKDRLHAMGIRNDFLVNIVSEDDWLLNDGPHLDRYPYPKAAEMNLVDRAFSRLFEVVPNARLRAGAQMDAEDFEADDRFDHLIGQQAPTEAVQFPPREAWDEGGFEIEVQIGRPEGVDPHGAEDRKAGKTSDDFEAGGWFSLDI